MIEENKMIFKKKKAEEKFLDSSLGKLIRKNDWVTEKVFTWEVFNQRYEFFIYLAYTDEENINPEQSEAILFLLKNYTDLQSRSEKLLLDFFNCEEGFDLSDKITIEDLNITAKGEIVLSVNSSFGDEFLNSNIPDNIIFDDCFGVLIYPKEKILPNEKELYRLLIN